MKSLSYLLERLREPSTWAGLAILATAINPKINADHAASLAQGLPVVFGLAASLLPDAKAPDLATPPVVAGQ